MIHIILVPQLGQRFFPTRSPIRVLQFLQMKLAYTLSPSLTEEAAEEALTMPDAAMRAVSGVILSIISSATLFNMFFNSFIAELWLTSISCNFVLILLSRSGRSGYMSSTLLYHQSLIRVISFLFFILSPKSVWQLGQRGAAFLSVLGPPCSSG